MTAPKPMTRQELVELAALDALGMLDEYEASLYTRSFHHAPSAVQNELLELQAQIAADPALLATEDPTPELRERVLEAVNQAIEQDTPNLTPLATIGASRFAATPDRASAMIDNPNIVGRISHSSSLWRVATFALCGMVIVMAYLLSVSVNQNNALARLALGNLTDAQLEQMIGPTVKDYIFDAVTTRIVMTSPNGESIGRALLFVKEGGGEALLIMELPRTAGEEYELALRKPDGTLVHVARFAGMDRISGLHVPVALTSLTDGSTWQINGPDGFLLVSV